MWAVPQILTYLAEHGIAVVRSAGEFRFRPPAGMPKEVFEFHAEVAKSHISPQRDAFISQFEAGASVPLYRSLPPAERRRFDFRRVQLRANVLRESYGWRSRVVAYSAYTLQTFALTVEHKAWPDHATLGNLEVEVPAWAAFPAPAWTADREGHASAITDQQGRTLIAGRDSTGRYLAFDPAKWLPLADSRPPPKWREYPGFVPPPDWHPPPGWAEREARRHASQVAAARRKWYRENWGTGSNLPD